LLKSNEYNERLKLEEKVVTAMFLVFDGTRRPVFYCMRLFSKTAGKFFFVNHYTPKIPIVK